MNASKVIEQARAWLGLNEYDGTHKEIIDIYNAHKPLARGYKVKYTDSWCATFVSAVAIKLGYTDIIPTECSCGKMIALLQAAGVWVEDDAFSPSSGDIIFYDWDDSGKGDNTGWSDHVGIVEQVANGIITVIEGNLNNRVDRREIAVNARYIRGYGVPKYSEEKTEAPTTPSAEYYPQYTGATSSIVNALKSVGVNSAFSYRKKIAEKNGITNYTGAAAQNTQMLNLLKQGKLIKAEASAPSSVEYYPRYTGNTNSIVNALKSVGVNSAFSHRKKIAAKNGIKLYIGTSSQNTQMLNLLKSGKLIKV